jgi:glycosyltransferase involved in cell wall biosynthesis
MRANVAAMLRIKNESRWIRRSLERIFMVAKYVVILDDGSTDNTETECKLAVSKNLTALSTGGDHKTIVGDWSIQLTAWGFIARGTVNEGETELHFLNSPFTNAVRPKERVNEIRDKRVLWAYAKCAVPATHWLCFDGDEMPSLDFVRNFPTAYAKLENEVDILHFPFVYLWDSEDMQRVDGIYGSRSDGMKTLNFPRYFTIKRCNEQAIFDMTFAWEGTKGGFHCGSIPREKFPYKKWGEFRHPIVHFGYLDDPLRQRKYVFYNQIDPGNKAEGEYKHIIGQPNVHAPGPVRLEPWRDE